jgi:8-oxo-dGTP pyrophosphatase MutT (NUDIX family)
MSADDAKPPAEPATKPLREAATVMLLRDTPGGVEVFMLRRTLNAAFVGGAYVFPGGTIDDADRTDDVASHCVGLDDATASDLLGIERGGLAYWVAALRECFEEAGVLLARTSDGTVMSFADAIVAADYNERRHAVHDGTLRLVELCGREGLHLATDDVRYVSHWVTPIGEPRRFDTRFFVARAPHEQEPLHDDNETIDSLWVRPADALDRHHAGELFMIFPTIKNLEFLVPFATCDEALAAASAIGRPPMILPRVVRRGESIAVLVPGDAGYDDPDAVDADLTPGNR